MALEAVQEKYIPRDNIFYRKYYHYFLIGLSAIIVISLIAVGILLYQTLHRPLPEFYAIQPNNQKLTLAAFDEPNLLPETILRWSSKAATVSYTFDYANYENELKAIRPYFTEAGWSDYQSSVRGLISTIVKNQLIVNGIVRGTPVISNQGPLPGRGYVWRVQIPFLVTYQTANTTTQRKYYVIITIVQVPTSFNPQGIGIDQFVMV